MSRAARRRPGRAGAVTPLLVLIAVLAGLCSAPAAHAETCRQRIAIECPRVTVPLDRGGAVAGTVPLYVERLGEDRRKPRALLVLAGGPGQAATPFVPELAPALAKVLDDRDVVFFDQRGTGRSGRLRCAKARRGQSPAQRLAACAQALGPRRDHYASSDSVADIEDVRRALGIERLVLYGTSYGTKVALEYAAAHPGRVEGLVLDAVVPPGPREALESSTIAALPRVLRDVCRGGRCRALRGDPFAQLRELERRLAGGRYRARRITGSGRALTQTIPPGSAIGGYQVADFVPELRATQAGVVAAALRGDRAPLVRFLARVRALQRVDYAEDPLFVATVCADTALPWSAGASAAGRRAAALRAASRLPRGVRNGLAPAALTSVSSVDACLAWPSPAQAPAPVAIPDVPALVLNGTADLRTPVEDARALARRLPRAKLLTVRGAGHAVLGATLGDCPGRALLAFLRGRTVRTDCPAAPPIARPALPQPARLEDVRALPGVRGRAGRVAAAALATARDVRADSRLANLSRVGGLRGGWYRSGFSGLELHRVEVVRGVRVSGWVTSAGYWLRIRARGASGRLVVQKRVRGTLGGVRIEAGKRAA